MQYTHNLEDLIHELKTRKDLIVRFMKKHFKENQHFIIKSVDKTKYIGGSGILKKTYLLTKETFELIQSTYNLNNRYITKVNNVNMVNPLLMSIENSTIGFICQSIDGIVDFERQYKVGDYFVDLYLPKHKIVIECDEFGHKGYNTADEIIREDFIKDKLQCQFIRFNPCSSDFQLPILLNTILKAIL
jgi:very-short-patch-repair endonuclease